MQNLLSTLEHRTTVQFLFVLSPGIVQEWLDSRKGLVHVLDVSVCAGPCDGSDSSCSPLPVDLLKLHKWALFDNFLRAAVNLQLTTTNFP